MTARRSRMHRTRTGKPLALTARDLELFRVLRRYRFLRSTYLHAFVGGASKKRFKERLGNLFHEGYLDRPEEQWRFADTRFAPVVHELGKGGADAGPDAEPITWLREKPHRQFEHSLMICEALASIELACLGRNDIRFIPWPEILARAPQNMRQSAKPYQLTAGGTSVIPDALFGIEYRRDGKKSYRFFALEGDRGTMPIIRSTGAGTSVLSKFAAYRNIFEHNIHHSQLGVPKLLVLTATTSELRKSEIMRHLREQAADYGSFLFKCVTTISAPDRRLLWESWDRATLDPVQISGC